MYYLTEQWLPTLIVGLLVAVGLFGLTWFTQRRVFWYAMFGSLAVTAGLIALERYLVTEAERVEAVLYAARDALVANDPEALLSHISPDSSEMRNSASSYLRNLTVTEARIKPDLTIALDMKSQPPVAQATFHGVLVISDTTGAFSHQRYAALFRIRFRQEDGEWKMRSYEHEPATHSP